MPPAAIGSTSFSGEQLLADAVLVRGLGNAGLREQQLEAVERELAVVLEARVRGDPLEDLLVRHREMQVGPLLLDQPVADHVLQDAVAHLGIVEERRVHRPLRPAQHLLLVAQRIRELGLRDAAAVEARDFADRVAAAEVVVDAEERERQRDQREDELDDPLVLGDDVEHVRTLATLGSATAAESKRANSRSPLGLLAEWTGLEPATPGVTGRYSNQLNYHSRTGPHVAHGGC